MKKSLSTIARSVGYLISDLYHLSWMNYHEWRGAKAFRRVNTTESMSVLWRAELDLAYHNAKLRHHRRFLK